MKNKILCILSGLLFAIIFAIPLNAEPLPIFPPSPPTPRVPVVPILVEACPAITIPPTAFTCDDVPETKKISLVKGFSEKWHEVLQRIINDNTYRTSEYEYDDVYKLCFRELADRPQLISSIYINFPADKPTVVSGLKIQRALDLREEDSNFPLVTINSRTPIILVDTELAGIGPDDRGKGLVISGCNHQILNTIVHDFNEGIRIEGSKITLGPLFDGIQFDSEVFEKEKVEIYNNTIGLHWVSGDNVRFPFNLIHHNVQNPALPSSNDGFKIDRTLPRPEITLSDPDPAKNEGLFCTKDAEGKIVARYLNFKTGVEKDQEVVVYESDNVYNQASNYLLKCIVDDKNNCSITLPSYVSVSDKQCGDPSWFAIALVNAPDHTSAPTMTAFKLDGPVVALGAETGVDTFSPGSMARSGEVPEVTSGGNEMAGSGGAIEGQGTGGGCGKSGGGATIVPPQGLPGFFAGAQNDIIVLWWLIFTAPAILVAVRIKKSK